MLANFDAGDVVSFAPLSQKPILGKSIHGRNDGNETICLRQFEVDIMRRFQLELGKLVFFSIL